MFLCLNQTKKVPIKITFEKWEFQASTLIVKKEGVAGVKLVMSPILKEQTFP